MAFPGLFLKHRHYFFTKSTAAAAVQLHKHIYALVGIKTSIFGRNNTDPLCIPDGRVKTVTDWDGELQIAPSAAVEKHAWMLIL